MLEKAFLYEGTLQERRADLLRIAKLEEPILRNLLITQRYHDLSQDLKRLLGSGDANWSTFACWASKTAGQSIRQEEVPPELMRILKDDALIDQHLDAFYRRLGWLSRVVPRLDPADFARSILDEVSEQIARGNLEVYAELAPLFAEFAEKCALTLDGPGGAQTQALRAKNLEDFVEALRDGPADKDGQDSLKSAFRAYFEASICDDPCKKAQLILFGNALIGFHEQTRLQKYIAGGLDAPFSDRVYARVGKLRPQWLGWLLGGAVKRAVALLAKNFLDDWQRIATRHMMRLTAPNGQEIPLGADLPPRPFDPLLAQLTLPLLVQFLLQFDTDLMTTKGSGAINWTVLKDRMKFIAELFRVSQRQASWFDPPFSTVQRDEICQGKIPSGLL